MMEINHVSHFDPPASSVRVIYVHADFSNVDRGQHGRPIGEGESADMSCEEVSNEEVFDSSNDIADCGGPKQG